jgi:transcriptional regulator with XRE-family HTH domain
MSAKRPTTIVAIDGLLRRLNALQAQHGSLRAVARVLEIDAGYLSRLKAGEKLNPSDALLRKLGLRRYVQFSERG